MTTFIRNGCPISPSGLKVKPQSYASLEQVAIQLRGMLPLCAGERYRLDCQALLEITLPTAGYNFHVVERDEIDECAAFTVPDRNLIVFREDVYDCVANDHVYGRSTVVHEMSHIVLGHAATLHRGATLGEHKFYEDSEWQAKALTAAMMMSIEAAKMAASPERLAEMCGTSVEAARYRMDRLTKGGII